MNSVLTHAGELKQALSDFVLDAEGDLAVALESFSASELAGSRPDMSQRALVVDRFIAEGKVGDRTPIDLFIDAHPDLSESDRQLLQSWRQAFVGLFAITTLLDDGVELMNWTTAKHYTVKQPNANDLSKMARLKVGEILLTQIAPLSATEWMFFSPWTLMGKLGKPKLAVAIGNFKEAYKSHLYSDAPELLEEAWKSVEKYHQDFVDFFGEADITLPGYQLNKKFIEFQEIMTQKRLQEVGLDPSKSLKELADEAGISDDELSEAAQSLGADSKVLEHLITNKASTKMVAPKVDLPDALKRAEAVTVFAHPRWGQMLLPTYSQLTQILEADDWAAIPNAPKVVHKCLEDKSFNTFVWRRLAQTYPTQLEAILRVVLERPDFKLSRDLDALLVEFDKPLEPELPEIASVPIHLHDLFQEAIAEVSKDKPKGSAKKKSSGFQR